MKPVPFPAAMLSECWVHPGSSAPLTLHLSAPTEEDSPLRLTLALKGGDSPATDGEYLVSGLGANILRTDRAPTSD